MSHAHNHMVVTGGGSGVGQTVALTMAGAGTAITIIGRRKEPLREVCAKSDNIQFQCADVRDADQLKQAFARAHEENGRIDQVVASAGIADSKPFHKLVDADFRNLFETNLIGVANAFNAGLSDVTASPTGRLIAIASTAGLKGYSYVSHYCASKHAVIGLVRGLAIELASSGITVNAICPSFVKTPMTDRSIENIVQATGRTREQALAALTAGNPQSRLIEPSEIAASVAWLCSDAAASVNGQAISLCGGET